MIIIALLMLNLTTVGFLFFSAQKERKRQPMHEIMIRELELNPGQQKAFKGMRTRHRPAMDSLDQVNYTTFKLYFSGIGIVRQEAKNDSLLNEFNRINSLKARITRAYFEELNSILD